MWIFSTLGFFSIVRKTHPAAPRRPVQIRARRVDDLRNLARAASLSGDEAEPIVTPSADYCARLAVSDASLARVMAALTATLAYANFKSAIHALPDQADKSSSLSDIWEVMYAYQTRTKARRRG